MPATHTAFKIGSMNPLALPKIAERLNRAAKAGTSFRDAGLDHFASAWSSYLSNLNSAYNFMEIGARGHPKSEHWIGGVKGLRRSDPLLCYLHHARNADEHGLEKIIGTAKTQDSIIATAGSVTIHSATFTAAGETVTYGPADPKLQNNPIHTEIVTGIKLVPVTDKGVTFPLAEQHLGKTLTGLSLSEVAWLAHEFYVERFLESKALVP